MGKKIINLKSQEKHTLNHVHYELTFPCLTHAILEYIKAIMTNEATFAL
jgi:hypothetical protein